MLFTAPRETGSCALNVRLIFTRHKENNLNEKLIYLIIIFKRKINIQTLTNTYSICHIMLCALHISTEFMIHMFICSYVSIVAASSAHSMLTRAVIIELQYRGFLHSQATIFISLFMYTSHNTYSNICRIKSTLYITCLSEHVHNDEADCQMINMNTY